MSDENIMGKRIKQLRLENNLTLKELAEKLDVQFSAVNKWESGAVKNIKRSTIDKMANIFGVAPTYLMGYSDYDDNLNKEDFDQKEYVNEPNTSRPSSRRCNSKPPVYFGVPGMSASGSCDPSGASGGCSSGTSSCTGTASSSKTKEDTSGIIPMPKSIAPGETYVLDFEEAYIINKYRSLSHDNKMELFTAAYKINNDPDKE